MELKEDEIGEEDRVEMYREFYDQMIIFGYAPFYIGKELAFIIRATRPVNEAS